MVAEFVDAVLAGDDELARERFMAAAARLKQLDVMRVEAREWVGWELKAAGCLRPDVEAVRGAVDVAAGGRSYDLREAGRGWWAVPFAWWGGAADRGWSGAEDPAVPAGGRDGGEWSAGLAWGQ